MMRRVVQKTCESRATIAYYSGMGGLEIRHIEYGIEDHVYLVAGCYGGKRTYHRLKIHYDTADCYIRLYGCKYKLSDFIRA